MNYEEAAARLTQLLAEVDADHTLTTRALEEAGAVHTEALLASPYRTELAAEFGEVVFLNAGIELKTFDPSIIPLLQEYFYEDYEKIQLVLGDNSKEDEFKFILDRQVKVKDIFNGNPDVDLPEKAYSIQHSAFMKLESYKKISRGL